MDAFNCGFFSIVPRYLVQIFDEKELELLLGGIAEIDVEDWKRYTEYRGGYSSEHQVVESQRRWSRTLITRCGPDCCSL
jgi:E3 ubiquitin-protein ligase NEDD4